MRCLVTGATGFVGSYLVEALIAKHGAESVVALVHPRRGERDREVFGRLQAQRVATIEQDLLHLPQSTVAPPPFDAVYHLAAAAAPEDPASDFSVNDVGTLNLLRWLGPTLRGKRFLFTSTLACVDKPPSHEPIVESTPCHPRTEYGRTKLRAEEHLRRCRAEFGYSETILRLCTIMGHGVRSQGMFGVCPQLLARRALSARLNWPGRSSFMHVNDLVTILLKVAPCPEAAGEMFVLSNGEDPTFDELLGAIASVLKLERRRITLPRGLWRILGRVTWIGAGSPMLPARLRLDCWRAAHVISSGIYADSSRLNRLLGLRYQSVIEGLREVYRDVLPRASEGGCVPGRVDRS